jgi:hypothetical protein
VEASQVREVETLEGFRWRIKDFRLYFGKDLKGFKSQS